MILNNFSPRTFLLKVGNPHFYSGRSLTLVAMQKLIRLFLFLRSPKPKRSTLDAMRGVKNRKKGKRALILGNGPSLDKLDSSSLSNYFDDIFVVNSFHDLQISEEIEPTYYTLSDPLDYLEPNGSKSPSTERLLDFLASKKKCTLVLPHTWEAITYELENTKLFFDDRERTFFSRNILPIKPRGYTSVTLYKALSVACYMGYSEIYVLGLDNTEFYSYYGNLNNTLGVNAATYAKKKIDALDSSNTSLSPFVSGIAGRMQSYAHLFGDLRLFSKHKISNLDPNSLTDAFIKIESHPCVFK